MANLVHPLYFYHTQFHFIYLEILLFMEELMQESQIFGLHAKPKSQSLGQSWSQINFNMKETLNMNGKKVATRHLQSRPKVHTLGNRANANRLKIVSKQNRETLNAYENGGMSNKAFLKDKIKRQYNNQNSERTIQRQNKQDLPAKSLLTQSIHSRPTYHIPLSLIKNQRSSTTGQPIPESRKSTSQSTSAQQYLKENQFRMKKCFSGAFQPRIKQPLKIISLNYRLFPQEKIKKGMILPKINISQPIWKSHEYQQRTEIHSTDVNNSYEYLKMRQIVVNKKKCSVQLKRGETKIKAQIKAMTPLKYLLKQSKLNLKDKLRRE